MEVKQESLRGHDEDINQHKTIAPKVQPYSQTTFYEYHFFCTFIKNVEGRLYVITYTFVLHPDCGLHLRASSQADGENPWTGPLRVSIPSSFLKSEEVHFLPVVFCIIYCVDSLTIIDFFTFYKVNGGCRITKRQNLQHLVGERFLAYADYSSKDPNLSFWIWKWLFLPPKDLNVTYPLWLAAAYSVINLLNCCCCL